MRAKCRIDPRVSTSALPDVTVVILKVGDLPLALAPDEHVPNLTRKQRRGLHDDPPHRPERSLQRRRRRRALRAVLPRRRDDASLASRTLNQSGQNPRLPPPSSPPILHPNGARSVTASTSTWRGKRLRHGRRARTRRRRREPPPSGSASSSPPPVDADSPPNLATRNDSAPGDSSTSVRRAAPARLAVVVDRLSVDAQPRATVHVRLLDVRCLDGCAREHQSYEIREVQWEESAGPRRREPRWRGFFNTRGATTTRSI